jgi:hypothetical protein
MPTDKKGKFHMGTQRAMASDKHEGGMGAPMSSKGLPPQEHAAPPEQHQQAAEGHPIHAGLRAAHAGDGGKHMHVSHDGFSLQSHHVGEDGQPQGPHDHENLEALKQHMDQFFSEEGQENGY